MRDCSNVEVREVLPDFARGELAEPARAAVLAHLDGCDACRAEVAVLRAVRGAFAAPRVDVSRIVGALPATPAPAVVTAPTRADVVSLEAHRAARTPRHTFGGWRRAAAIVAVLVGGGVTYGMLADGEKPQLVASDPRTAPVAESVAPSPQVVAAGTSASAPAAIGLGGVAGDLTSEELELVLASLETFDGVPTTEPTGEELVLDNEEGTR